MTRNAMAEFDSNPATAATGPREAFELEDSEQFSRFLLHSRTEILFVLKALREKKCLISVNFDQGSRGFLTSLIAINPDTNTLILDYGSEEDTNERAAHSDRLLMSTILDKVKVQFSLRRLERVQYAGHTAFQATLPEVLLRLQRREYYRLTTPILNPIKCQIPNPETGQVIDAHILDISGGGLGLMLPPDENRFAEGTTFDECRFALPEEGMIAVGLLVRNTYFVTTKGGASYLRIGCEFQNLPGTRLTMIQRYITRIERERKAREMGLS